MLTHTHAGAPLQTFPQFLANLAASSIKQTMLQSTPSSNNIAGLYKQQATNDHFKDGSSSGSVHWTAGAPDLLRASGAATVSHAEHLLTRCSA